MKIKYTPVGDRGKIPKPYVTLVMCSQEKRIKVDGLIDSGSDHNLFSIELAEICGIDLTHAVKVSVSGFNHGNKKDKGHLVPVKFVLGNYEWMGDTVFVETSQPHGFLGQSGFFDAFDVTFSYTQNSIDLKPVNVETRDGLSDNG